MILHIPMPIINPHIHKPITSKALHKARNKRALVRRTYRLSKWMEENVMDGSLIVPDEELLKLYWYDEES